MERKNVSSNPVGSSRSIDKPLDIDPDAKEFDLLNNSVISGKVYFDVGIKGKIYLSFDECYVDFVLDYTIGYSVSINAEIEEKTIKLTELSFRPVAGVRISFVPKLIFSASASIALDMSVNGKIGFGFSTDSGFSNKSSGPSTHSKIKIEGDVYLGVALEPSIRVISKKIAVASTEARAGLHFEAELDTNREDDESFIHECKQCASGKLSIDLKLSADLKFFGSKKFHYSKTIFDKSYELCEFYYSFDYDEFDWTSCPHLKYRVNATVTKDGVPYPNATVMVYGDRYAENVGETDENGKLSFYLPDDLYVMDVEGSQAGFVVYKKGADVTLDVTEEPTKPTEPETTESETTEPTTSAPSIVCVASGICGTNVKWELFSNGTLHISGSGWMSNYSDVKSVPWYKYRDKITNVNILPGVYSIGKCAFSGCVNLKSITIPYNDINRDGYTLSNSIGDNAFSGCISLERINIPDCIRGIGKGVFSNCKNLTNITLPEGVTNSIGYEAFYNCESLKSITIPSGVKSIGSFSFYGCSSLVDINIPNTVTAISSYSFEGCSSLAKINIPDSVTSIGLSSFSGCKSLTCINIPNSVTGIYADAFYGCSNLTNVTIPNSVEIIDGGNVFGNCVNLESIYVSQDNMNFSSIDGVLFNKDKTTIVAFPNGKIKSSETYEIPDGVTSIGEEAFWGCSSLTSVVIPKSVTSIGRRSFGSCINLKNIYFECDRPKTESDIFECVTATAYYPIGNLTWEDSVFGNYGGDITWVPYDPNVPIIASTSKKLKSISLSSSQNTVKDTGISTVTAEYDNKVTNTDYIIAVVKDPNANDILSADNLLYIDQFTSDNDGKISVLLPVSSSVKDYEIVLFGPHKTTKKGDVDGDGEVTVDDATAIQKYAVEFLEFDSEQIAAADVDGDGKVSIGDVTIIQKYIADIITSLG